MGAASYLLFTMLFSTVGLSNKGKIKEKIIGRQWSNGQDSTLPRQRAGFNSRLTHFSASRSNYTTYVLFNLYCMLIEVMQAFLKIPRMCSQQPIDYLLSTNLAVDFIRSSISLLASYGSPNTITATSLPVLVFHFACKQKCMPPLGIEPRTFRLQGGCSTN